MTSAETVPLLGRCVSCRQAFRVEIPADTPWAYPEQAIRAAGMKVPSCGCQARGIRCPSSPNGLPACGDDFCDGHGPTEVKFSRVQVTYSPGAVCGPGNCWGAVSSKCTCSCNGKNHGQMWAVNARW